MPEGPEMRRAADRIGRYLVSEMVESIRFAFEDLRSHERELKGRRIVEVATRGKALLIHFEHDWSIYTHNQLYGRWYLRKDRGRPATNRQLRLAIETARGAALLYSASDIEVWPTERLAEQSFLARVGPDLLSDGVSVADVHARLDDTRFRSRQLAGVLLDQGCLAGIGNYLRADIMFAAGIHPKARWVDLDETSRGRLAEAVVKLVRQAYRTAGVTNDADRVEALKARGVRRSAFRHLAYDRDGDGCWECATPIQVAPIGGRKLYFCPACQQAGSR